MIYLCIYMYIYIYIYTTVCVCMYVCMCVAHNMGPNASSYIYDIFLFKLVVSV